MRHRIYLLFAITGCILMVSCVLDLPAGDQEDKFSCTADGDCKSGYYCVYGFCSSAEWIYLKGGAFNMGSADGMADEQPVHQVDIRSFGMSRTEVTVSQYRACVDDGACTAPDTDIDAGCNWNVGGRDDHPVNCVDWFQADIFCTWTGGRLPSEAEWEYAARSGGQDIEYPWGDYPAATCQNAVMDDGELGCGQGGAWPVCSKPAGNTSQGLCDMAGNVWEWAQDWYHGSYDCDSNLEADACGSGGLAPANGSAWEVPPGDYRVRRGGCWNNQSLTLMVYEREYKAPLQGSDGVGFRCARDVVDWVEIPGGSFMMGSDSGEPDELPVHQVAVPDFKMSRTEVTVAQYQECVNHGPCTVPGSGDSCNWNVGGRAEHPVNCVDWRQAVDFCTWAGGRLPSEAEWEYAARSGGQEIEYPWGDHSATCQYAVMSNDRDKGCGLGRTWPVCGKPEGNTSQGLCDMAGNISEWVQDGYHDTYDGAPTDGSAWEDPSVDKRVIRGGAWSGGVNGKGLRASSRYSTDLWNESGGYGFRCAR